MGFFISLSQSYRVRRTRRGAEEALLAFARRDACMWLDVFVSSSVLSTSGCPIVISFTITTAFQRLSSRNHVSRTLRNKKIENVHARWSPDFLCRCWEVRRQVQACVEQRTILGAEIGLWISYETRARSHHFPLTAIPCPRGATGFGGGSTCHCKMGCAAALL